MSGVTSLLWRALQVPSPTLDTNSRRPQRFPTVAMCQMVCVKGDTHELKFQVAWALRVSSIQEARDLLGGIGRSTRVAI